MLAVKRVVAIRSGSSASCAKKILYVNTNFVKSVKKINLILLMIVYTELFPVSLTFLEATNTEEMCVDSWSSLDFVDDRQKFTNLASGRLSRILTLRGP